MDDIGETFPATLRTGMRLDCEYDRPVQKGGIQWFVRHLFRLLVHEGQILGLFDQQLGYHVIALRLAVQDIEQ